MKDCILSFPNKGNLGITKNYKSVTSTAIVAKVYNGVMKNKAKKDKLNSKSEGLNSLLFNKIAEGEHD